MNRDTLNRLDASGMFRYAPIEQRPELIERMRRSGDLFPPGIAREACVDLENVYELSDDSPLDELFELLQRRGIPRSDMRLSRSPDRYEFFYRDRLCAAWHARPDADGNPWSVPELATAIGRWTACALAASGCEDQVYVDPGYNDTRVVLLPLAAAEVLHKAGAMKHLQPVWPAEAPKISGRSR